MGALAGPAAALPSEQSLRSADAAEAGLAASGGSTGAERAPQTVSSADTQDLRSADASDAGANVGRSAGGTADRAASSDFHWGDAAIGAGSVFALAAVSLGVALALQARRRRNARPSASAVTTT